MQGVEEGVVEDDSQVIVLVTEWNVMPWIVKGDQEEELVLWGARRCRQEMYPVSEVKILAG